MADYIDQLPLTHWFLSNFEKERHSKFPGGGKLDYADILKSTHIYLNTYVHPRVEARAAASDPGSYLTDHGPDHIKMVMARAQYIVASQEWAEDEKRSDADYTPCLAPYEVFLLIMAIHFHDVGNIYGRVGHEKRIKDVMEKIPPFQSLDGFEQGLIARIATCHGGTIEGDRDTIRRLAQKGSHGTGINYRPQLIAAVLRLADELAEDRTRADTFGLLTKESMPLSAIIYHKYASALGSVYLDPSAQEIRLQFQITKVDAEKKYTLGDKDIHLIDYIYERTLKTYREVVYCSRFMNGIDCRFHKIAVEIQALCDIRDFDPIKVIHFRIGDTGFPDEKSGTLITLAKEFDPAFNGEALEKEFFSKCHGH